MTKTDLEQLKPLILEINNLQKDIDNIPITSDSVTGSRLHIPYDKHSIPIEGLDIKKRIRLKARLQIKLDELQEQLKAMEDWLDTVEDSEMRVILRLKYRNSMADAEIGLELGYDRSTISYRIRKFFNKK